MRTYNFTPPRADRGLPGGLGEPPSRFWRGVAIGAAIVTLLWWALAASVFILAGPKG